MAVTMTEVLGTDTLNQQLRKVDMRDKIDLIMPAMHPLTILTKKVEKKIAINTEFSWPDDVPAPKWDQSNGVNLAAAATINVHNSEYFRDNDVVKVPRTGEVMLVTAAPGGGGAGTLDVTRGWGLTVAADINDLDYMVIIGTAFEEGGDAADSRLTTPEVRTNRVQIFKNAAEATNTEEATETYGSDNLDRRMKKKTKEHVVDIERSFLFGSNAIVGGFTGVPGAAHPRRTTSGLDEIIDTTGQNYDCGGAPLTEIELLAWFEMIFQFTESVTIFHPMNFATMISISARFHMEPIKEASKVFGFPVYRLTTPHGNAQLIMHPLLEGPVWGRYCYSVSLEQLAYRYLKGRDTSLEMNIQLPGEDRKKHQWLTECGLEARMSVHHGRFRNWA